MYQVLYRKYRPRFFADVIGQPQVTETLRNELRSNRIAHAYLFTGSRGTGKTTCSKILAKAVNCLSPHDGDPCGECEICKGIDDGSILDVVEIDAASNNGVDDIRTLREEVVFTPANTKYRVYIIDEVHMLSIEAFNALLKTLEEPPGHVVFILATTEVHKLPATILSRCQRFDFHRIPPKEIAGRLTAVCAQEGIEIDDNAALLIAGIADGAMRDALSLLDQCVGRASHITEEIVRQTAGLADKSHLIALTDAFEKRNAAAAISIIDELYRSSKDMARLGEELTSHFRELMLMKTMKDTSDILVMSEDDRQRAEQQAQVIPLSDIVRSIEALQEATERMLRGANRRIEMEMTAVKLCSAPSQDSSGLEDRVNALEKAVRAIRLAPVPQQNSTPAPRAPSVLTPAAKRPSADEMEKLRQNAVPFTQWPEVIEKIAAYSKTVSASFNGSIAYISGRYVLVDSKNDICFELLRKPALRDTMRDAIKAVTGQEYKLGRYSYPDEEKKDDVLDSLLSEMRSSGVPVEEKNHSQ